MANPKKPQPMVRRIATTSKPPLDVPDNKRPLREHSQPGGLPPEGIKGGWKLIHGSGHKLHTHS